MQWTNSMTTSRRILSKGCFSYETIYRPKQIFTDVGETTAFSIVHLQSGARTSDHQISNFPASKATVVHCFEIKLLFSLESQTLNIFSSPAMSVLKAVSLQLMDLFCILYSFVMSQLITDETVEFCFPRTLRCCN